MSRLPWAHSYIFALLFAMSLSGCGGSAPISVSVSTPSPQTIDGGSAASISATVMNDSSGVNWTVSCPGSPCGQVVPFMSQSGQQVSYTAPDPNPSQAALMVSITATSVKDPTKFASTKVTVASPLSMGTSMLPDGTVGVAYSQMLQAAGGIPPYTWSLGSSSLPIGLSLSSSGAVTGTPTASGNVTFNPQITDSGNPPLVLPGVVNVSINTGPPSVTTTSLPNAILDTAYTQTLQASGGIPPYTWSVTSGSLPIWATLDSAGRIRGIPEATGSANFTVQATDSEVQPLTTATQSLSITVTAGSSPGAGLLKGHYAFFFGGFDDASGAPLTLAGSFTADGAGNITAGILDESGSASPAINVSFTGTYSIATDQRGAFTITTANGSRTFACVLGTVVSSIATKGRFVEFDDYTGTTGRRGSGILRLQDTTAFALASITGPYAFGFSGVDPAGKREVRVGRFDADGAGAINNGVEDVNDNAVVSNSVSLTGTYAAPSASNGRASLTLNGSGSVTTDLTAYVVSAKEILVVSSDPASSGSSGGLILSQASTSFSSASLSGNAIFYNAGVNTANPTTESSSDIGIFNADGAGNATEVHDQNNGGLLTINASITGMTYATATNGRVVFTGGNGFNIYLVDANKGFLFDPGATVGLGFVESQAPAPAEGFTNASLSGTYGAGTVPTTVSAITDESGLASLDGINHFQTNEDVSTTTGLIVNELTSGSYAIDTNGRGLVTSIVISLAGFTQWMILAYLAAWFLLSYRERRRSRFQPRFAALCLVAWVATVPDACRPPRPTEIAFYLISPAKAVMVHLSTTDKTPPVAVFEQ